ncbi:MAG: hypothetical protein MET45_04425 [Nostoc sp. LLA-1]|nr:hypothetical protein [Cyanocohniella sp. LLY]
MDADKKSVISTINVQSQADAELERKLRELKFKQELRKDWILFIVRDVVIFPAAIPTERFAIAWIFAITGYSLFVLLNK